MADLVSNSFQTQLTDPLNLYVSVNGNDLNEGSFNKPFKTVQRALDYLKTVDIISPVFINIGAGTFNGFRIDSINFKSTNNNSGAYLSILGEMGVATLNSRNYFWERRLFGFKQFYKFKYNNSYWR